MQIDGHELLVTPADFETAMRLQAEMASALQEFGFDLGLGKIKPNAENILKTELPENTLDALVSKALSLATNKHVINILFECCKSVTFGKDRLKVDRDFFESVDNRKYFYPIMVEVAKQNLVPFIGSLGSLLKNLVQQAKKGQK